jgi:phosphoribosylanthranilate isomerase
LDGGFSHARPPGQSRLAKSRGDESVRTRVKVCCIASLEEARLAVRHGADALGLVARMPSGPGVIADSLIRDIARALPPGVASVLLSSETDPDALVAHARATAVSTLQIVDAVQVDAYAALRLAAPALKLVQVIHVEDARALEDAARAAPFVDGLLLDSGRPRARLRELGGTGRRHDWALSRRIVEAVDLPVFLAGGLSPANVREAIATVRPYGLDLCTGVRHEGRLDPAKLEAFMEAVGTA